MLPPQNTASLVKNLCEEQFWFPDLVGCVCVCVCVCVCSNVAFRFFLGKGKIGGGGTISSTRTYIQYSFFQSTLC